MYCRDLFGGGYTNIRNPITANRMVVGSIKIPSNFYKNSLYKPRSTLMAFTGVTHAHGPSPQPTAWRSPTCSLRPKARFKPTSPKKSGVDRVIYKDFIPWSWLLWALWILGEWEPLLLAISCWSLDGFTKRSELLDRPPGFCLCLSSSSFNHFSSLVWAGDWRLGAVVSSVVMPLAACLRIIWITKHDTILGNCWWHSWQSGRFRYQRTWVRIQSMAVFLKF